jgi:hypothetical protein
MTHVVGFDTLFEFYASFFLQGLIRVGGFGILRRRFGLLHALVGILFGWARYIRYGLRDTG